jgi:rhamnosyltransferase
VLGFNGNTFISRLKKYTVFDGKSFLINKHTDQLFVDFWHSGNKTISAKDKKIFIDYFSAKENKIKFFLFVVKNRICIRKKLSTSLVKMLLIKNLIEK